MSNSKQHSITSKSLKKNKLLTNGMVSKPTIQIAAKQKSTLVCLNKVFLSQTSRPKTNILPTTKRKRFHLSFVVTQKFQMPILKSLRKNFKLTLRNTKATKNTSYATRAEISKCLMSIFVRQKQTQPYSRLK